jgi:hypothetical protein
MFPHRNTVCTSPLSHSRHMLRPSHSSGFDPPHILVRSGDHKTPHYVVFSPPLLSFTGPMLNYFVVKQTHMGGSSVPLFHWCSNSLVFTDVASSVGITEETSEITD